MRGRPPTASPASGGGKQKASWVSTTIKAVLFVVLVGIAYQAFHQPARLRHEAQRGSSPSDARRVDTGKEHSHVKALGSILAKKRATATPQVDEAEETMNSEHPLTTVREEKKEGVETVAEEADPTAAPPETEAQAAVGAEDHATEAPPPGLPANVNVVSEVMQGIRAIEDSLLIRQAKESNALRACFITLTRHDQTSVIKFGKLLRLLKNQVPSMAKKYPFVAFHESKGSEQEISMYLVREELVHQQQPGFDKVQLPSVRGPTLPWQRLIQQYVFPAGLRFGPLTEDDFGKIPRHVSPEGGRGKRWNYGSANYWGVKYRHMCRFFGVRIFFQQVLDDFDFYMRLDTDSYILAPPLTMKPSYVANSEGILSRYKAEKLPHPRQREIRFLNADGLIGVHEDAVAKRGMNNSLGTDPGRHPAEPLPHDQQRRKKKKQKATQAPHVEDDNQHDANHEHNHDDESGGVQELDLFLHFVAANPNGHTPDGSAGAGGLLYPRNYGFVMLHPQDQAVFLRDLWETMEQFIKQENRLRSETDLEFIRPKSLFDAPRHNMIHYWDNFEVVNLRMFRDYHFRGDNPVGNRLDPDLQEDDSKLIMALQKKMTLEKAERLHKIGALAMEYLKGKYKVKDLGMPEETLWARVLEEMAAAEELKADSHKRRRTQMTRFLDWFDRQGGFYYNRWGDAEVRTLLMSVFAEPSEIAYFTSVAYQHYHNFHCPSAKRHFDVPEELQKSMKTLAMETEKKCNAEAARDHGPGAKGRGSAPMDPAEHPQWNTMFRKHVEEDRGWTPI